MNLNKKPAVLANQKQYGVAGGSRKLLLFSHLTVNRPPSANNRGLPNSTVVNGGGIGARGTAL
jgi:hypothetical protein